MSSAFQYQRTLLCEALPPEHPSLLLMVDSDDIGQLQLGLRSQFDVRVATTEAEAVRSLKLLTPAFLVTELDLSDGDGVRVCEAAKSLEPHAPAVLIVTADVERVPQALTAGCHSVLLKPFAPNLLHARLGRLMRNGETHSSNQLWTDSPCPYCQHDGIVSFDGASHRRMWYACLACEKVWLAARREH